MGRATSGVTGMKFRSGDSLLAMSVIPAGTDPDVFVVFENGIAKRTAASQWTAKGRGIFGVTAANSGKGGQLVGALTVEESDEVMVVMERGNIVRTRVNEVSRTGRNTMGVSFAAPNKNDSIVAVARNPERPEDDGDEMPVDQGDSPNPGDAMADAHGDGVTSPSGSDSVQTGAESAHDSEGDQGEHA